MKNPLNCPFVPSFLVVVGTALLGQAIRRSRARSEQALQGSQDRGQKIDPRILRAALDLWNNNRNLTWNDVASAFGFISEDAATTAVRKYAKKHGLRLRLVSTSEEQTRHQRALAMSEEGLALRQISERLGYKSTGSAHGAIEAARRMRRLDELYGRDKNPLRRR